MKRLKDEVASNEKLKKSMFLPPIMDYIEKEFLLGDDKEFVAGLDNPKKTIEEFGKYAYEQAKKLAGKEQALGVPDSVVYGWLRKYFTASNRELYPEKWEKIEKENFYKTFDKENLAKNTVDQLLKHAEYEGIAIPDEADQLDIIKLLMPKKKRRTKKKAEPKPTPVEKKEETPKKTLDVMNSQLGVKVYEVEEDSSKEQPKPEPTFEDKKKEDPYAFEQKSLFDL